MSLDQLIRQTAQEQDEPAAYEATVARDAVAGEPMKVRLPAFDGGKHLYDAIGWAPIVGPGEPNPIYLPQKGDAALVAQSDEGNAWCVAWWPASFPSPGGTESLGPSPILWGTD